MEGSAATLSYEEIHDLLTHGVIGDFEDLMGIGEFLSILENLEAMKDLEDHRKRMIPKIKDILNRLILEESPNPSSDWERLQKLVLQMFEDNHHAPMEEEVEEDEEESIEGLEGDDLDIFKHLTGDDDEHSLERKPVETEPLTINDPELARDFIEEAREHLESIELNMIALETNPKDGEAINSVFRPFHSIKGVSGFLNLTLIHQLSHEVENLLDSARSGNLHVDESIIDVVLSAVDVLKMLLDELESALSSGILPPPASVVGPLIARVRALHAQSGTPSEPSEATPPPRPGIPFEEEDPDDDVIQEAVRRSTDRGTRVGDELVAMGVVSKSPQEDIPTDQGQPKEASSVRVDTHKLDNLVDMVGELVIAQSMVLQNEDVQQIRDQKLQKDINQLGRITAELQRISLSMRMVPIRATFQKLIRLVRDLSKKSGKDAVLEMNGEETEIDRNMVELIYEPLVHMIRNSMDHGLELPEERIQAGKPGRGKIALCAEQKGGNILIKISDDGRGLDVEKIRRRAIEREVISPADKLDDRSIYDLIFHPGFSTKDAVTEVSGRGVGMDVVKKAVERLRGKIETTSTLGRGSSFALKLPLTMAIIDGMIIRVGEERFIVPTIALKESLRPSRESCFTVQGKGEMIKVRETLMPLVRLHELFNVEPRRYNPWEGLLLVVNEDNQFYSLLADEIVGRQEVVIKNLGTSLRSLKGLSGGAILGDGRVALILDVKGMVSLFEEGTRA